jgi:hypothetical protein
LGESPKHRNSDNPTVNRKKRRKIKFDTTQTMPSTCLHPPQKLRSLLISPQFCGGKRAM